MKEVNPQSTSQFLAEGTRAFFYELVPNALGIEKLRYNEKTIALVDKGQVVTKTDHSGWLGTQLGLTLANLRAPQVSGTLDPYFEWRSKGTLFYRNLEFLVKQEEPKLFEYRPTEVRWYGGQLGIGPEVGLDTPIGLFYAQIVPTLAFNYVSTDEHSFKDRGEFRLSAYSEIGYGIYITDRLYFQVYGALNTMPHLFKDAIKASYDSLSSWNNNSISISGINLSYFFPEGRSRIKKIIRDF